MNAFEIIRTVRLTEKGTRQGEKYNQYTVVADRRANKTQIRQAVQELFKVKVTKVNTLNVRGKVPPPAHHPGRPGARLEKGHRDAERGRQDCFDVISAEFGTPTRRPSQVTARKSFRAVFCFFRFVARGSRRYQTAEVGFPGKIRLHIGGYKVREPVHYSGGLDHLCPCWRARI